MILILIWLVSSYKKVCEDCTCGGQEGTDFKKLDDGIPTADECFELANKDSFCGKKIIMDENINDCFCIGTQRTCTQEPKTNWHVYSSTPGNSSIYSFLQKLKCFNY